MNRIKFIGRYVLLCLTLASCCGTVDTKAAYLQRYASYITAVKRDYAACDSVRCADYDLEFVRLSETQYLEHKQELSAAEQQQVDTWYWEYHQAMVRRQVRLLGQQLQEGYRKVNSVIKTYINP